MLQLTKSLAEETQGLPVGVHTLSPGLVYTDLVACGQNTFGSQVRWVGHAALAGATQGRGTSILRYAACSSYP